jgi:23S rRNA (adenine2503-C2)-methyltransferase
MLPIYFPTVDSQLVSPDGRTVKLLLRLKDGQTVETVLMMHDYGNSVCISSQVGCAVNCAFCASAKNGFIRDLTAGEMTAQLLAFRKFVTKDLHSIVIMGTGEPLLNYDNVLRFIRSIHEEDTFFLGYRNVTLSTAGIVPRMYDLANEGIPLTLAISLHAPNDELRRRIMPIANKYPLADILRAGENYFVVTGRKVTLEYILIKNLNCTLDCAQQLVHLFAGKNLLINAIPINDNYDVGLYRPTDAEIEKFVDFLKKHGVQVTLRREMGSQIQAACGQLRIQRDI